MSASANRLFSSVTSDLKYKAIHDQLAAIQKKIDSLTSSKDVFEQVITLIAKLKVTSNAILVDANDATILRPKKEGNTQLEMLQANFKRVYPIAERRAEWEKLVTLYNSLPNISQLHKDMTAIATNLAKLIQVESQAAKTHEGIKQLLTTTSQTYRSVSNNLGIATTKISLEIVNETDALLEKCKDASVTKFHADAGEFLRAALNNMKKLNGAAPQSQSTQTANGPGMFASKSAPISTNNPSQPNTATLRG